MPSRRRQIGRPAGGRAVERFRQMRPAGGIFARHIGQSEQLRQDREPRPCPRQRFDGGLRSVSGAGGPVAGRPCRGRADAKDGCHVRVRSLERFLFRESPVHLVGQQFGEEVAVLRGSAGRGSAGVSAGRSARSSSPAPVCAVKTTTRSASAIASSMECVTRMIEAPLSRQIWSRKSCILDRVWTSSAANGSSIISTLGRMASARAQAARWRMPPDNSSGFFSSMSPRPTERSISTAMARRSVTGTPRTDRPKATLSTMVSQGNSEASWKIRPRSAEGWVTAMPSCSIVPAETPSKPGDHVEQRGLAAARRARAAPRTRRAGCRG